MRSPVLAGCSTTALSKVVSGTTYLTRYAFNLGGQLASLTYPSATRIVQETYDSIGRLCAVGQSASTCTTPANYAGGFTYSPAGEITAFTYGNGVIANLGYSADRLQLTNVSYKKGSLSLFSLAYWYKADATNCPGAPSGNDGQIQCVTDAVDSGRTETLSYDALARLSSTSTKGSTAYPQWGLLFVYDRYGNRLSQSVTAGSAPGNSVAINTSTNRISTTGYSYDANGNMTNDGSNSLTYDAENRLVTSTGSLGSGTYTYDGNSLRVKKVSAGLTTVYAFSGSSVIAEYVNGAGAGSPTREYVYSTGALIAKIESGVTNYYHADNLSIRASTDASGNLAGQQGQYSFGESWYQVGPTNKWRFNSYERDSESANDYAMARYDVNRIGRFSIPDASSGSVSNPQSLNRYAYVQNDPVNAEDPSGMLMVWGVPGWFSFGPAEAGFGSLWDPMNFLEPTGWGWMRDYPGPIAIYGNAQAATVDFSFLGAPPAPAPPPHYQECLDALKAAHKTVDDLGRALADWNNIQQAASVTGTPAEIIASIGIYESGYNPGLGDGGHGHGVFQFDDRSGAGNSALTLYMADDTAFASQMVGDRINRSYTHLLTQGYSPGLSLAGAVRNYNGSGGVPTSALMNTGYIPYLNLGTKHNNYVSNVLAIASNCFR